METERKNRKTGFLIARAVIMCVLILSVVGAATYAWLASDKGIGAYAPISSPIALRIGAGHADDIRFMRFDELDVEEGTVDHFDNVFCVYGSAVRSYNIQLAYTTFNSDFTYELYRATQSTTESAGAVKYITNEIEPQTFYYSIDSQVVMDTVDTVLGDTYGSYVNVQTNANPVYLQTHEGEEGNQKGDFINYYILRINTNGKTANDRETDVFCIAVNIVS
ncbi:MAG: hypothetical protein J6Y43_03155 [Clostridia bacterium]|nr:hypothetical protein [Clostridia bacterium]